MTSASVSFNDHLGFSKLLASHHFARERHSYSRASCLLVSDGYLTAQFSSRQIFRDATLVQHAFDMTFGWSLESEKRLGLRVSHPHLEPQREDALFVKKSLSVVCRAWRSIVLPFLFEIAHINLSTLAQNRPTLADPNVSDGAAKIFSHVRRLELVDDLILTSGTLSIIRSYQHFSFLFQLCPNLVIFTHCSSHEPFLDVPVSIIEDLLLHCGKSLRRIELNEIQLPDNFPQLLSAMAPQLECLEVGSGVVLRNIIDELELPALHSLRLRTEHVWTLNPWKLPHLAHLDFRLNAPGTYHHFSHFTGHITMLNCQVPFQISPISSNQLLFALFPCLQVLDIQPNPTILWVDTTGHFPALRRVRLFTYGNLYGNAEHIGMFQGTIEALTNRRTFPSLTKILVITTRVAERGKGSDWWKVLSEKMDSMQIRHEWTVY